MLARIQSSDTSVDSGCGCGVPGCFLLRGVAHVAGSRHRGDLDLLGTDWTGQPPHENRSETLSATGKPAVAGSSVFGGMPIVIWWLTGLGWAQYR